MLVFFIHGVNVRDVNYAKELQDNIAKGLRDRHCPPAYFQSGFWGDVKNPLDDGSIWNDINSDLKTQQQKISSEDSDKFFRYQDLRKDYLSPFVIDLLSYLAPNRGQSIRAKLANQLKHFADSHPDEQDLHIISHSLGTVILWDILFSDRFVLDDPAFEIRHLLQNSQDTYHRTKPLILKSLTTMGSPILFLNTMFDVSPKAVQNFVAQNPGSTLKWLNIIHASDVIAYPLKTHLKVDYSYNLSFKDIYIKANGTNLLKKGTWFKLAEKVARKLGSEVAAIVLSTSMAHESYWTHQQAYQAILEQILSSDDQRVSTKPSGKFSYLEEALALLVELEGWHQSSRMKNRHGDVVDTMTFADGSGTLKYTIDNTKVHHIHFFNPYDEWQHSGYVYWKRTKKLKEVMETIRIQLCE